MKQYKIIYDSELCGTQYVDELYISESISVEAFIDEQMYRDEMDIPDDVEVSVLVLDEKDPEFEDF